MEGTWRCRLSNETGRDSKKTHCKIYEVRFVIIIKINDTLLSYILITGASNPYSFMIHSFRTLSILLLLQSLLQRPNPNEFSPLLCLFWHTQISLAYDKAASERVLMLHFLFPRMSISSLALRSNYQRTSALHSPMLIEMYFALANSWSIRGPS
jgi:hypothetical protein